MGYSLGSQCKGALEVGVVVRECGGFRVVPREDPQMA